MLMILFNSSAGLSDCRLVFSDAIEANKGHLHIGALRLDDFPPPRRF